ncbi:lipocalin-like domain-containing protein [Candidatus Viridilinea mediisalina]|uniref:Carotenoid 1,2-hydratase n=1 Tax=Candidatus Viridilinea mediisalina TaxID=2024553 RepID=A0A2A6RLQ6_9CHLR|nr:lipocalin-like domain-containing protein [Candidatus Viridilinea mediisalina]PDW04034.1 carotenoid 1,2-hydratase [Candidatus Viridilinea mediisalina]
MLRIALSLILLFSLVACTTNQAPISAQFDAVELLGSTSEGFARAYSPKPFSFPRDHGPHPAYQFEWWYYTGNLYAGARHFGYQLTFFRSALSPNAPTRDSAWGTNQIYMAHLALSDSANERLYAYERFSRGAAGLAGATGEPFRVFLEDWSAEGSGPAGMQMHLQAAEGPVALDLNLVSEKPPVLHGEAGLSQKGPTPGNASFYYSLSRMATSGSIMLEGERHNVSGTSWMDHEWGTSALEGDASGWDWFSIQLEDGRELMYAQVRTPTGLSYSFGSLIATDGQSQALVPEHIELEVLNTWTSPRSGATYPVGWRLNLRDHAINLEIEPTFNAQELPLSIIYWEGAVRIRGTQGEQPLSGHGYVELTGYGPQPGGRVR